MKKILSKTKNTQYSPALGNVNTLFQQKLTAGLLGHTEKPLTAETSNHVLFPGLKTCLIGNSIYLQIKNLNSSK